jgi:hypothetical protein
LLFRELVRARLARDARVSDPAVAEYVAGVLVDFTHIENLYRIRDARGRRLEQVGEMLAESDPLQAASSFDRERAVRKHIGDFTLFFTGLFPESLATLGRRGLGLDALLDYVRTGKESYRIVSCFDQFEYAREAPVFRRLAEDFELCVFGLNLVKQDLERLQRGYYRNLRAALS